MQQQTLYHFTSDLLPRYLVNFKRVPLYSMWKWRKIVIYHVLSCISLANSLISRPVRVHLIRGRPSFDTFSHYASQYDVFLKIVLSILMQQVTVTAHFSGLLTQDPNNTSEAQNYA